MMAMDVLGERGAASEAIDVVVLGAGPAGLAAAREVARAGRSVLLVDPAPVAGGIAAGWWVGDQRVDLGHPRAPLRELAAGAERAGILVGHVRPASDAVLRAGRLAPLPRRRAVEQRVIAESIALRWWGTPLGELQEEAVSVLPELLGVVPDDHPARHHWWMRPSTAVGHLRALGAAGVDRWVAELTGRGATVRTGCTADGLRAGDGGWRVHLDDGAVWWARLVVSARAPGEVLPTLRSVPAEVANAAAALRRRSLVVVGMLVAHGPEMDAVWCLDRSAAVARVSLTDAPAGHRVLCAELPMDEDDPVWFAADSDVVLLVRDELRRVGMPVPPPLASAVWRRSRVIAVPRRGADAHLARATSWIESHDGLLVAAHLPTLPHHQLLDEMEAGRRAGRRAVDRLASDQPVSQP